MELINEQNERKIRVKIRNSVLSFIYLIVGGSVLLHAFEAEMIFQLKNVRGTEWVI